MHEPNTWANEAEKNPRIKVMEYTREQYVYPTSEKRKDILAAVMLVLLVGIMIMYAGTFAALIDEHTGHQHIPDDVSGYPGQVENG